VPIHERRTHEIARLGLGFAPEESGIFPDLTVAENIQISTWTRPGGRPAAERLAAAYGAVLPDLVGEYLDLRRRAQPASDGPVLRVLGLILADEEAASAAGESLLQVLVGTSDEAGNATSESRRASEVVRKA